MTNMILNPKTVIVIAGPTAVGKTSVAIQIAKKYQTEIISADSRQCYKELNIGVARPSEKELQEIPHHFIASHSIHEEVNASIFEQFALKKTCELFKVHDHIVMVGGTGLYIKAFCEGLDEIPGIAEEIRNGIRKEYEERGMNWLQQQVQKKDPLFFNTSEIKNPHRLLRALEVKEGTGRSIVEFRKGKKKKREFSIRKIGLALPKEQLHNNVNKRVETMIYRGLVDEVKKLYPFKNLVPLQTVGYKELFDYLDDKISLEAALERIKKNTRNYAKRQITWFRKDKSISWFQPNQSDDLTKYSKDFFKTFPIE